MRTRALLLTLLLMSLLAATSIALADPVPRAVPDNDNFPNAKTIKLGKNYTVLDPGAATEEPGELRLCGGSGDAFNSVWFRITVDTPLSAHFSTGGSVFHTDTAATIDTVLSLWSGTGVGDNFGNLTNVTCVDDAVAAYAELNATLSPGVVYYLQLHTYGDGPLLPESFYKLITRVLVAQRFPVNFGFEDLLGPDDWSVKNETGDARLCNSVTYPPLDGNCSFAFTGGPSEASKLVQTVAIPGNLKLRKDGVIIALLPFGLFDAATVENAKFVIKLNYKDGTPPTKASVSLNGLSGVSGVTPATTLASGKLESVKLQVVHKSTSGVLLVDTIFFVYVATPAVRDAPSALLSVPAAP